MLTIVIGKNRLHNSKWVIDEICKKARQGVRRQILIVPEQFSHETERALCKAGGDSISRFVEVLSLSRMADRVFTVYGGVCEEYLDENGRILTLYRAAQQVQQQLKVYAACVTKVSFLKDLGTLVEELQNSCITPDQLLHTAKLVSSRLSQKMQELAILYESYLSICKTGRKDPVTKLMRLEEVLTEEDYLEGRTVWIEGFSDFTALQERILFAILCRSQQTIVCMTADRTENAVFQTSTETVKKLLNAAKGHTEAKVEQIPGNAADDVQLQLEGMFAVGSPAEPAADALQIYQVESAAAECSLAAGLVQKYMQEGVRYRDICIAVTDMPRYENQLRTLFSRAGIPTYYAGIVSVQNHPAVRALRMALAAVNGYELEDVLSFLKSGYASLSAADCDCLEQYARFWKLHGVRWEKPWDMHPKGLGRPMTGEDETALAAINAIRQKAMAPLCSLRKKLHEADCTREMLLALWDFLQEIQMSRRLQQQTEQLLEQHQNQRAQECGQVFDAVCAMLEQMVQTLGDIPMDEDTFRQLLFLMMERVKVGSIPTSCDELLVTDLPMLRHSSKNYLIVLGAEDGKLPAFSEAGGLLADDERMALRSAGMQISPGLLENLDRELGWVYSALRTATVRLHLVFAQEQPSYLVTRAKNLYPKAVCDAADVPGFCPDASAAATRALQQGYRGAQHSETVHQMAERREKQIGFALEPMKRSAVSALYGDTLSLSASKLDKLAGCRYAYFLQYGLGAKPWKEAGFDAPLFGSFVHDVLEHTVRDLVEKELVQICTDEDVRKLTRQNMNTYLQNNMSAYLDAGTKEAYFSKRHMAEAEAVVLDVVEELRRSSFVPGYEELTFGNGKQLPPVAYQGKEVKGLLTGAVDRVDFYEQGGRNYYRILDYKTGTKSFEYAEILYGGNLQMLLYLFALQRLGNPADRSSMEPAGVLYVHSRDDMIPTDPGAEQETILSERQKLSKRDGLLLDREDILQAMEHFEKAPRYLPVKVKKDGITGALANSDQFRLLGEFVEQKVAELMDSVAEGKITPNPVVRGPEESVCKYCDFFQTCHKDVLPVQQRNIRKVKPEEFWNEVERRLHHD